MSPGRTGGALPSLSDALGLAPGHLVAIMGAGGKATVMKRLVRELLDARTPVLVTATTNLHSLGEAGGPSLLLSEEGRESVDAAEREWAARGPIIWVEKKLPQNMFRGLPPEEVAALHEKGFGGVLVAKTDGARKRLIKAPGEGEPVLPRTATHALVVLGLNAIGRPAGPDIIHRFDLACRLADLAPGQPIEARHLAALASHPESYPGRLPAGMKRALYLSHCIGEEGLRRARAVWEGVPPDCYDLRLAGDTVEGRFHLCGEES
ncbi:MAG: selenium cofactor biosynthesis protein YqeC [bacterium]